MGLEPLGHVQRKRGRHRQQMEKVVKRKMEFEWKERD
jgi:hypothetical protein